MVKLPGTDQRISIIGRTGSGKTVAAQWHLSEAAWDRMPYVIYDFKRDRALGQIEALQNEYSDVATLKVTEIPQGPGLYFVHPMPHEWSLVENQMWRIWERENTGVYVDEGYMIAPPGTVNHGYRALLTQGRSKTIPLITLSQRPVWLDRFVFSESDYFQVFQLLNTKDRKTMMEYVPGNLMKPLPHYHSYYHDVSQGETVVMKPVPDASQLLTRFAARLEAMRPQRRRRVI